MTALPYPDLGQSSPAAQAVLDAIAGPRAGHVSNLFRMMLHSPPITEGWSAFGNQVRFGTAIDDRTRELIVLTVAHRASCEYEWKQHEVLAEQKGVSRAEIESIPTWPADADLFDEHESAIIGLAAAVSERAGPVPPPIIDVLVRCRGESGVVEVVAASIYYLAIAHFVIALGVEPE